MISGAARRHESHVNKIMMKVTSTVERLLTPLSYFSVCDDEGDDAAAPMQSAALMRCNALTVQCTHSNAVMELTIQFQLTSSGEM